MMMIMMMMLLRLSSLIVNYCHLTCIIWYD